MSECGGIEAATCPQDHIRHSHTPSCPTPHSLNSARHPADGACESFEPPFPIFIRSDFPPPNPDPAANATALGETLQHHRSVQGGRHRTLRPSASHLRWSATGDHADRCQSVTAPERRARRDETDAIASPTLPPSVKRSAIRDVKDVHEALTHRKHPPCTMAQCQSLDEGFLVVPKAVVGWRSIWCLATGERPLLPLPAALSDGAIDSEPTHSTQMGEAPGARPALRRECSDAGFCRRQE